MKDFNKPQSKENAIALGFTLGVHVVAIVGLLFLGMSKPLEPPKQLKTVLVKPEDIIPPEAEPLEITDSTETADTRVAENVQQTADPVADAPNIPVTAIPVPLPPTPAPKVDMQKAAAEAKAAEAEQKAAVEAAKAQAKAAETARLKAVEAEKAQKEAAEKIRQAKNDAERAKAEANAKAKAEAAAKTKQEAAEKTRQDRAAQVAKEKAAQAAKAKQEAADKAKRERADAAAKAKQEAADKAKRERADAAAKAKQEAADKAKERAAAEAKASAAQKAKEEAATKKAEVRKIASSAKRDFENKVRSAWRMPSDSSGQKASARVTLTESGGVASVVVNASDPDVKASVEQAVRAAAPFPMPSDPDARREARSFTASFTVK